MVASYVNESVKNKNIVQIQSGVAMDEWTERVSASVLKGGEIDMEDYLATSYKVIK